MNPFESKATCSGSDKRKRKEILVRLSLCRVEIKREVDVKVEPNDTVELVTIARPRTLQLSNGADGSIDSGDETYSELADMKDEIKCEDECSKNDCDAAKDGSSDDADGIDVDQNGEDVVNRDGPRSSGNGKGKKKNTKGKKLNVKTNFKRHLLKHTDEKPFPCEFCLRKFAHKTYLKRHMKTHADEFPFNCSRCLQGFQHSEEKAEHEADCKVRRYKCDMCKYFTVIKLNLVQHMRTHSGERPFGCDQCSKKFTQKSNLTKHRKTHIDPRPLKFKCAVCFKIFAQQMEKEKHEANCKRRGYACDVCKSYTTLNKSDLIVHMRIHSGEKPFHCDVCSKWFSRKGHLNRHKKIHK